MPRHLEPIDRLEKLDLLGQEVVCLSLKLRLQAALLRSTPEYPSAPYYPSQYVACLRLNLCLHIETGRDFLLGAQYHPA